MLVPDTISVVALPSPGLLEMSPVERGVVTLFGVRSGLFIAMNNSGHLYSSVRIFYRQCDVTLCVLVVLYSPDCDVTLYVLVVL